MINVGIVGYGNLGKGVSLALAQAEDMQCVGIFTRREASSIKPLINAKVYPITELENFKGEIDVLILCGGSATDLPSTTKEYLKQFNTVDSFDTHAKIPEYFDQLNDVATKSGKLCAISIGWDPGLFSIMRSLFGSVLSNGKNYTFWGKGVSQGHSDAIRRIDGVENAIQYTIPINEALELVRSGKMPNLETKDKHLRECFVALKEGADKALVEKTIKEMPNYFADYTTIVNFVSNEQIKSMQEKLSHGGIVLHSGKTSAENKHLIEFSLTLDSNPEFTGSVLVAYARAVARLAKEGKVGALTVYDIPLKYLSTLTNEQLRKVIL